MIKVNFILSILISAGFASFMLYAGFQNNNQGEFYDFDTGVVDCLYCIKLWSIFFAELFIVSFSVIAIVAYLFNKIMKCLR